MKIQECGCAALLSSDGNPLIFLIQLARLEQRFPVRIRAALEALGPDLHVSNERKLAVQMNGPVAEELDLRLRHRCAAVGVRHPPLLLPGHVVLHEHRVHAPDERVKGISASDAASDPPRARLVERDFQIDAGVAVLVTWSKPGFPGRRRRADVFRATARDEALGEGRWIHTLPVQLAWVSLEVGNRVADHVVHGHRRGGELDNRRVAEDERQLGFHARGDGRRRLEAAPVPGDLQK